MNNCEVFINDTDINKEFLLDIPLNAICFAYDTTSIGKATIFTFGKTTSNARTTYVGNSNSLVPLLSSRHVTLAPNTLIRIYKF